MAEGLVLYTDRLFIGNRSQVQRWARRLGADFAGAATAWAPVRSGELKASIFYAVSGGYGKQIDIDVGASAPHALFVIMGTGQYVGRPRLGNPHGRALPVGRDRAWGPKRLVFNQGERYLWKGVPYVGRGVSGQAPQNFFKVAHQFVIPLHPSTAYIDWEDAFQG
jgi:hypothetical protein